jgi:hypothetical protein
MSDGFIQPYLNALRALATQHQQGASMEQDAIGEVVSRFDDHASSLKDGSDRNALFQKAIGLLRVEITNLTPDPRLEGTVEQQQAMNAPRIAVFRTAIDLLQERATKPQPGA